jgi:gluconate 2-dehydrogenase gamma chain
LTFFNEVEAATVDAMAARIIPTDVSGPGAREAQAMVYIDRALAGFYRDLQTLYRRGVAGLDNLCQARFGKPFRELAEEDQDVVLISLDPLPEHHESRGGPEERSESEQEPPLRQFFAVVRRHTLEGIFCDPVYGGNQGLVGWKLVGFPGAQWSYSEEQMTPGFDATQIPIKTLADLRREHGSMSPAKSRSEGD